MVDKTVKIQTCAHEDEISIYVGPPHNIALCNDCYFDGQDVYGKSGKTLKKAALEQIQTLEGIYGQIDDSVKSCSDM